MQIKRWWKRAVDRLRAARHGSTAWFGAHEIEDVRRTYYEQGTAHGGPWDRYRHAHMVLPDWFEHGLDPLSAAYAAQQHRLWALVAGSSEPYSPASDEMDTGWDDADPIRQPGFYMRRDPLAVSNAADHVIAAGMLLKHSGLRPGDWALEYGPGFAQGALALARLGVNVDTVDVSERFCGFVRRQAEHFGVPLHALHGQFGDAPERDGLRYQLIWFYESFHHCVDFLAVLPRLEKLLADGGRIILSGEPIVERQNLAVPYPWGVRLHSEVAAVMRQTRWFELGFSEDFLYRLFARVGLRGRRIDCELSAFGRLYIFERDHSGTTGPAAAHAGLRK